MSQILAREALLPEGWVQDVAVTVAEDGRIAAVETGVPGGCDILLPAPVNVHSHAFQRAMAGMTETRGPGGRDSFWTWRRLMYRFLNHLTPDHVEAIAALVQMEMLEAGYGCNVEFHYLHHQPGGAPYDSLAEMAERIASAAEISGIGLTLLPVLYRFGGLDQRPLEGGQRRFGNNPDRYAQLVRDSRAALRHLPPDATLGTAPHSLRATTPIDIRLAVDLAGTAPVHMHLAEQAGEVTEVEATLNQRPVAWAVDNLPLDSRWCLIHCTQMRPDETVALARTGAVAGLCPLTESSLGDGIFDGVRWFGNGGRIAVGSDSNIRISLALELQTLEYSQRLRDRSRAALAAQTNAGTSVGRRLFDAVCTGGSLAAGRSCGVITPGAWADLVTLDGNDINLVHKSGDMLLDSFVFAGAAVRDVWSAGRHMVRDGQHIRRAEITKRYAAVLSDLSGAL